MTLRDLIKTLFRQVNEASGGEVSVCCPFCSERTGKTDTKFRLGINTATGIGNCFRCEKKHGAKGGRQFWFRELCKVFKVSYSLDAEERDAEDVKSRTPIVEEKKVPAKLPSEYEPLWKGVDDPIGRRALVYLRKRGITKEQIKNHRIGFCAVGKYAYRVIIPVYSPKGKLKAFVARDFSGIAELRYLNSKGDKTLFNVPKKKSRIALLGEGVFDVLAAERALSKSVDKIAGLGKSLSKANIKTLAQYKIVVIWPDPDRPGIEGAIKRALALQKKKVDVRIVLPDEDIETDTDLGALPTFEIESRFESSVPYSASVAGIMRVRVAHAVPKRKKQFTPNRVSYKA